MNHLLRPRIWPFFLASSGVGPCDVPSSTPRNQHPAVARWHAHLRDLATEIHEISGLSAITCFFTFPTTEFKLHSIFGQIENHNYGYITHRETQWLSQPTSDSLIFPLFHHSIVPRTRHEVLSSMLPLTLTQWEKSPNSGSKLSATDNVDYQPEPENSRYYVTNDSQGRKAKK